MWARPSPSRCSPTATRSPSSTRTPRRSRCSTAARTRPGRTPAARSRSAPRSRSTRCCEAGIERADAFVASTDGDNTNLVIAQIAQRRFNVDRGGGPRARPGARQLVSRAGPATRSVPTPDGHRACSRPRSAAGRASGVADVHASIVGAGKVGWNLARELIGKGNELTLIESNRRRYETVEEELEHSDPVRRRLRALGARARRHRARRPGDRRDRRRRGQHPDLPGGAREVRRRARRRALQQPAQPPALRAARRQAGGLGHRPDPAPDRARGAASTASSTCSTSSRSGSRSSSSRWPRDRRAGGQRSRTSACPTARW